MWRGSILHAEVESVRERRLLSELIENLKLGEPPQDNVVSDGSSASGGDLLEFLRRENIPGSPITSDFGDQKPIIRINKPLQIFSKLNRRPGTLHRPD
jgi:hypothetical protein